MKKNKNQIYRFVNIQRRLQLMSFSSDMDPRSPSLPAIVLTYPGSKFSAEHCAKSFEQITSAKVFSNQAPGNEQNSIQRVFLHLFAEKLAQSKTALDRGVYFSLRKQSVLKHLLLIFWVTGKLVSKKFRAKASRGLSKTLNVRNAYVQIWEAARNLDSEWVLLLEDDAELTADGLLIMTSLISSLDSLHRQGYGSVELSKSYDLFELHLENKIIQNVACDSTTMHLLDIGATNTACAAIFHKEAITRLLEDSQSDKLWESKYVPIDVFVGNSLTKHGYKSIIVSPGIVQHKSDFRKHDRW